MDEFNKVCASLSIDPAHITPTDFQTLKHWVEKTIGHDIQLNNLSDYPDFVKGFFKNVQPYMLSKKLTKPVEIFDNMTPLQLATYFGFDIYLQKLNPTIDEVNEPIKGVTLLQLAASKGHLQTVKSLLTLGADPMFKSEKGDSILSMALMLPNLYDEKLKSNKVAIFDLLTQAENRLLDEEDSAGNTILHTMATHGYTPLIEKLLLDDKALAFKPNNAMRYPLHAAILNEQHESVKLLLTVTEADKIMDEKGRNALHYAARYGDAFMNKICLASPIAKDSLDKREQTPLMLAVIAENIDGIQCLLEAGANVNLTDDIHRSALHYAVDSNSVEDVERLLMVPDIMVNISDDESHNPLDLVHEDTPSGLMIKKMLEEKGGHCFQGLTRSV